MKVEVLADAEAVARTAAEFIAAEARAAIEARGRFTIALSGGRTPWLMLGFLAAESVPWPRVEVFQVDERVAPAGHEDRNLTHMQESLLQIAPLRLQQLHAMPVEAADLEKACADYQRTLEEFAGSPSVLDLIHLGLGPDGHTASLVLNDPVLDIRDQEVAMTGVYQGHRRMTLTYPTLNRARQILWLVTGADKAKSLKQLLAADPSIPAGRVSQEHATLFADRAAETY